MIFLITMFKVWVVPAMTLMTPIMAWILPYILLRFVYALPIGQQEYAQILQGLWAGNMPQPGAEAPDLLTPRSIAQFIVFGFSFAQSMIQPIQNAMHLNKTDTIITGLGNQLIRLRNIVRTLRPYADNLSVKLADVLEELDETDARRAFLLVKEEPERLHMIFRDLANLEILWRLATGTIPLTFVTFKPDVLFLDNAVDISLKTAVPSSLELTETGRRHAIITGTNGGGKSSFLRAVLQSVVLGHSYGVAPALHAIMPRFIWIASGLQLRDTPGLYSMFETEVKFAADCIQSSRSAGPGPGLVLFDELFHSTNPPDGIRSAELFLKQLWAPEAHVYSIVSTHVFPLVESAPATVDAICCPASERLDGTIHYNYKVEHGISRVSSVRTVWEKYGLHLR
jgi:DNA mismatch repair ATPase MutS